MDDLWMDAEAARRKGASAGAAGVGAGAGVRKLEVQTWGTGGSSPEIVAGPNSRHGPRKWLEEAHGILAGDMKAYLPNMAFY